MSEDNVNINDPLDVPETKEPIVPHPHRPKRPHKRGSKKLDSPVSPIQNNYTIDEAPELQTEAEISDSDLSSQKRKFIFRNGTTTESILTMICYSPIIIYLSIPFISANLGIITSLLLTILFLSAVLFSLLIVIRIMIEKKYSKYISLLEHLTPNMKSLYYVVNCLFYLCYSIISTSVASELSTDVISHIEKRVQIQASKITVILFICMFVIAVAVQVGMALTRKERHYRYVKISQSVLIILCVVSYICILIINNKETTHQTDLSNRFLLNLNNPINFSVVVPLFNLVLFNQENLFNESNHLRAFTQKRGEVLIYKTIIVQGVLLLLISLLGVFIPFEDNVPLLYVFRKVSGIPTVDVVYKCLFLLISHIECGFIWKKFSGSLFAFKEKEPSYKMKSVTCVCGVCLMNMGLMLLRRNDIFIYNEIFLCLMGGICAGLIGYFFPGMVYLNMMRERIKKGNKKMIYGLIGTVVTLSGVSTLIGVSVFLIKNVHSEGVSLR